MESKKLWNLEVEAINSLPLIADEQIYLAEVIDNMNELNAFKNKIQIRNRVITNTLKEIDNFDEVSEGIENRNDLVVSEIDKITS